MESYEAIIVGGGPAGLNCAVVLAHAGKKALLIEKNSTIGPKVCAGGLTGDDLSYLAPPRELLDFSYREIVIHTPLQNKRLKSRREIAYTVDRARLGQWQLKQLAQTSVEIRTEARLTGIDKTMVEINGAERYGYDFLVGADGAASAVRKYLGLATERSGVCLQYIIPGRQYTDFELFFDAKRFGPWYAWIFPHRGYASIGCGSNPKIIPPDVLKQRFMDWLSKHQIDTSNGEYQAHTINYDYRGYHFGNVFLAGDAAGLTSGLTGEGIYPALVSGEAIADTILGKAKPDSRFIRILKTKKLHDKILRYLELSGPLLGLEFELAVLLAQNKRIARLLGRTLL